MFAASLTIGILTPLFAYAQYSSFLSTEPVVVEKKATLPSQKALDYLRARDGETMKGLGSLYGQESFYQGSIRTKSQYG